MQLVVIPDRGVGLVGWLDLAFGEVVHLQTRASEVCCQLQPTPVKSYQCF